MSLLLVPQVTQVVSAALDAGALDLAKRLWVSGGLALLISIGVRLLLRPSLGLGAAQ
jgi:hypothetical protein